MKYFLLAALSLPVIATPNDPDINIEPYLEVASQWAQAYYKNDTDKLRSLQTDKLNSSQDFINSKYNYSDKSDKPKYKCNHYYVTHSLKTPSRSIKLPDFDIPGLTANVNQDKTVSFYIFNECGINYVEHLSGMKLDFDMNTLKISNFIMQTSLVDKNGYEQSDIDIQLSKFESDAISFSSSIQTTNFDAQVKKMKDNFKSK